MMIIRCRPRSSVLNNGIERRLTDVHGSVIKPIIA